LFARSFRVKVGNTLSEPYDVISGVPQGSVLGPQLFLLYVADIPSKLKSVSIQYADDIKLYADPSIYSSDLQNDLNVISSWCEDWCLPLNVSKCVVMHLGKKNSKKNYYIQNAELVSVESHVDLGVVFSCTLSWSEHIIRMVKKSNSRSYLIKKSFSNKNPETLSKLFKLYVRPILEYANSVWYPVLLQDVKMIEGVQRRFTRWCYGRVRPNYESRLSVMNLISLSSRQRRGDLIYMYKIVKSGILNFTKKSFYVLRNDERLRGHLYTLSKQRYFSNVLKYFLLVRACDDWNQLPLEIINSENLNIFKNKIDAHFNF
jgi:hypothetical protein